MERIRDFATIDFASEEREIAALHTEKKVLEEGNDNIRTLKKRLKEAQAQYDALKDQRDATIANEVKLRGNIEDAERFIATANRFLEALKGRGEFQTHADQFSAVEAYFIDMPLSAADVAQREQPFREARREEMDQLLRQIEPLRNQICTLMNIYLRHFQDERADLNAAIEYLESFCDVFEQIRRDDLPRHELRFKERLNENIILEVGLFERGVSDREDRHRVEN